MKEIRIDGLIDGSDMPGSVSAAAIRDQLAAVPDGEEIVVAINSPGGSVTEGFAIYNTLSARRDRITTVVEGAAWSIASLIALAGGRVVARPASSIMIHDAWAVTVGNMEDHLKSAEALDRLSDTIAAVYAQKTGKSREEMRRLMMEETWWTPEEAQEIGFVDAVEGAANDQALTARWSSYASEHFRNYRNFVARRSGRAQATMENQPRPRQEENHMEENKTEIRAAEVEPTAESVIQPEARTEAPARAQANIPIPQGRPSAPPVAVLPPRSVRQYTLQDYLEGKSAQEQRRFLCTKWNELRQSFPLFTPMAANTDQSSPAGALVPAVLSATAITVLQNRLAMLDAFARNLQAGRIGRNTVQVPLVTAYGSAQVNPTNFENTTAAAATFRNVAITPNHISVGIHLDNTELLNGYQISWFAEIKAAELADAIQNRINQILTATNFTGSNNYAKQATAWTAADLKEIWARLSRAPVKNIILAPEYFKVHLPDNLESFNPLQGNTYPGWDGFYLSTYWTGAGTAVRGFACNPQAIAVAAGLPLSPPDVVNRPTSNIITLENNGMQVEVYSWFSPATRTHWMSMDVVFGAALGDSSAGIIIRDAAS